MEIIFVCNLVAHPVKPDVYLPASELIRNAVTGTFKCKWTISTNRMVAVGVADVTTDQLNAIKADSKIMAITADQLASLVGSISGPGKAAFKKKLGEWGVTISDNETIESAYQKIIALFDSCTVGDLLARLRK